MQIADWLQAELAGRRWRRPEDRAHVHVAAWRPAPGARTVTSALRGAIRDDAETRQEFLALTDEDIP